MTYCILDDGFDTNHKLLALRTDARRWTWLRIILHTCRRDNDIIPPEIADVVPTAKPGYIQDCIRIGLIDVDENAVMHVHDWYLYSGATVEEKVKFFLSRHPDATANDVAKQVVGTRSRILAAVREQRGETADTSQNTGTAEPQAEPDTRFANGSTRTTKVVHARARPLPLPKEEPSVVESVERLATDDDAKNDNEEEPDSLSPEVAALMPNLKEL